MPWTDEQAVWFGLHLTKGVGAVSFWRLIDAFGSAMAVVHASKDAMLQNSGVTMKQIAAIPDDPDELAAFGLAELERHADAGVTVLFAGDPLYPVMLNKLSDPPPVLTAFGDLGLLNSNCLAVVGSRACTAYGKRVAYSLAESLSRYNATVVSGLALGIDTAAHAGALEGGGKTLAVLGCGLDVVYPRQNKSLFDKIGSEGLLVSEYPLGTTPEAFRFPARNRIIAGLSAGVLVVEAARKSGSLITAQIAIDNNREVFAVPGQVDSYKSEGTHWLLKQGAKLVQSVDDIVAELPGICDTVLQNNGSSTEDDSMVDMDETARLIISHLEPYPIARDVLIQKTGLEAERISEWLLLLELDGQLELLAGDEIRKLV